MTIEIPENYSPNKLYVCTQDGHVARMPTDGGDPVDISPTTEQRATVGNVIHMVTDPYDSRRLVVRGENGVCFTSDAMAVTPIWTAKLYRDLSSSISEVVTFDPGGYPCTFENETHVTSDYGNPGNSATTTQLMAMGDDAWQSWPYDDPNAQRYYACIRVQLPYVTTVTCVEFDYYNYTQWPVQGHQTYLDFYDAAGNRIARTFGSEQGLEGYHWFHHTDTVSVANVASVRLRTAWGTHWLVGGERYPYIDNLKITYLGSMLDPTVPFGGFQAALNRENTYYWLSKANEGGTDYVYFNVTFDFFETAQRTRVARYSSSMVYGIAPSPFTLNAGSKGVIWVTAGDPSQGDAKVYESTDWGETFTALSTPTIGSGGGAILMPWSLPTGEKGATTTNLITLQNVENGNLHTSGLNGATGTVNGVGGPISTAALNAYMFDGAYLSAAVKNGSTWKLITSDDGGANWAVKSTLPGEGRSLTGIGASPDYLVLAGYQTLAITPDGGETWPTEKNLWSAFQSWANSAWTSWDQTLVSALIGLPSRPTHDGLGFCPVCYIEALLALLRGNPISAQDGDKYEEATDLSLNTPTGALAFTRTYRQSKQADYAFMGLGWTHNQRLTLTEIAGTPNRIVIQMPNAGEVHFTETATPGTYEGDPGSASTLVWNGTSGQYTLTASDKSTFVFEDVNSDGVFELVSRAWASGETWTYSYTNGRLSAVDDGYGRQIVFRYYAGGAFNGLLYRVGDQTFDDGDPENPLGRYVEYSYTLNKVVDANGAIVDGTAGLLTGVQDVRGQTMTYVYYGQAAGETDVRQLNFLVKRQSPPVDTTGDGVADATLTLENLTYTLQGTELAVNGGMEADSDWADIPGAAPTTNERSTAQVDSGSYSRHVVAAQGGQGIQGNAWNLVAGRTYILTARVYPVSGVVKMQVSGETVFDRSSSGTGAWQTLRAVYQPTGGATGKAIQFVADGGAAAFYVDSVSLVESDLSMDQIVQERGIQGTTPALLQTTFVFQPGGEEITTETTADKTSTYQFFDGMYQGAEDPAGNRQMQAVGYNYRPEIRRDANGSPTLMQWSPDGKQLSQVRDALGYRTAFTYNTGGASADTLATSTDAEGRQTEYTYGDSNNPRLPTRVKVLDGSTVLRWQEFTYDSQGRTLTEQTLDPADGVTVQQEVTRTYYTSGNGSGLLQTVTQTDIGGTNDTSTTYTYDSAGRVVKTQQNSNFGGCTISYTVYDAAGNVVASVCNYDPDKRPDSETPAVPTTVDEARKLFNPAYPDYNRITTYTYDALGRRISVTTDDGYAANKPAYAQTSLTVYDALDRVKRTIANYVADAAIPDPFVHDRAHFDHGTDNTQNLVTDTAYNERGAVRKSVDVLGNVTLYGYDDAGRLVKTVQSASQPNYDNTYETGDPTLANYTPGTDPDKDLITSQAYDPAGNLVEAVDVLGHMTFTIYDALNRPVKTVRSAKDGATISLNPGDTGYDAADDPRSDDYAPDEAPDRDLIDRTEYDAMGRVRRTQDTLGNWTLYGYDALGRQVKVIRNAATPDYDLTSDPTLASYTPVSDADQDIISQTAYDSSGRLLYSVDVQGERTWSKYDGLGRQIKTIANAIGTATDGSANDPRSDSYAPSTAPDRDLISLTHYDSDGRVQWTQDPVSRKTWYVYDSLGRQVKVIRNCTYTSGTPAPEDESYVGSADPDKDLITRTVYDAQGRVWKTIDDRGNETRYTYDVLGRQTQVITNYVNGVYDTAYPDEDLVTTTSYDLAGRVLSTVDAAGNETRYTYDAVGRRTQTIANYVDGVYSASAPDEDLITSTTFNRAGQVVATTDVRGTQTAFVYDAAGRTLQVTQAADTPLVTTSYTCYDKGGRTLRTIQNYRPKTGDPAPDARDGQDNWLFNPAAHGLANDENLITLYTLDKVGRQVTVSDPLGNTTQTTYFKAGGVESVTDPEDAVSQYRYDRLHRRLTVVQGYQANGEDPADWVWDNTDGRWEQSNGTAITFGTHNDRNVIAQAEYDKAGRMVALRDPRGNRTTYTYDLLDRRTGLTNPLDQTWVTAFSDLPDGKSRLTLTDPLNQQTQQDFDRLGRLYSLAYLNETPKLTPDVSFAYNAAGVRTHMDETADGGTTFVRKTAFTYDKARRLTSVGFDTNGDGSVEQTVSYQYDAGGLRTKLTLPGSRDIVYTYNAKGQLVGLTDWTDQTTRFAYDQVGRRVAAEHANGLLHQYRYDPAGRLKRLRHSKDNRLLGQFEYQVDKRGNRTQVYEALARATTGATTFAYNDPALDAYRGTWTDSASLKSSANFGAGLRLAFCGMGEATLRMGVGPDHSIYDVYVDGALWQSFNGYAASAGDVALSLPLTDEGPHLLDIRNRPDKDKRSTGYVIRFHSLTTPAAARQFDLHTTQYTYDTLARLIAADSYPATNTGAAVTRSYAYAYDLAGNRTQVNDNGTITNMTYNAINQISSGGAQYDAAGRMTSDGTNTYTWGRANRLLAMGGAAYQYNGNGQRVQQTVGSLVTAYLNDLQPGLWQVLQATTGTDTTRYVHGPNGLQQQQNPDNAWLYPVQDGLGSVRSVVAADLNVLESLHYAPYGEPWGMTGTSQTDFGFTGEPTDETGLVYLRARYYNPTMGVFIGLDPLESEITGIMSLNRYTYVEGNTVNRVDPSGMIIEPSWRDNCGVPQLANTCRLGGVQITEDIVNIIASAVYGEARSSGSVGIAISTAANLNKIRSGSENKPYIIGRGFGKDYGTVFKEMCPEGLYVNGVLNISCAKRYVQNVLAGNTAKSREVSGKIIPAEGIGDPPQPAGHIGLMKLTLAHMMMQLGAACEGKDYGYYYRFLVSLGLFPGLATKEIADKVKQIHDDTNLRIATTIHSHWISQLDELRCCMDLNGVIKSNVPFYLSYVAAGNSINSDGILIQTMDMLNWGYDSLQRLPDPKNAEQHICDTLDSDRHRVFHRTIRDTCIYLCRGIKVPLLRDGLWGPL